VVGVNNDGTGDTAHKCLLSAAPTVSPTVSPTAHPSVSPTVSPTANPSLSPTETPTLSPTETPTTSPTAASFPPVAIDFNFEAKYRDISNTDVAGATDSDGACPRGWTCTGVAQVKDENYINDNKYNYAGQQGQQYLLIGGDLSVGSATSAEFTLPSTIKEAQYYRMGGADTPSGLYIKDAKTSETICGPSASAGEDTDVFFEQTCDLSTSGGRMVYIFVQDKNADTATFGKVLIDDIHFLDVNGDILGNARYFMPKSDTGALDWQLPHKVATDMTVRAVVKSSTGFYMKIDNDEKRIALSLKSDSYSTVTIQRTSGIVSVLVEGDLSTTYDPVEMDGVVSNVGFSDGELINMSVETEA